MPAAMPAEVAERLSDPRLPLRLEKDEDEAYDEYVQRQIDGEDE